MSLVAFHTEDVSDGAAYRDNKISSFKEGLKLEDPSFLSRHGFSSWLTNRRRMVSRPTWWTTPRRCASCAVGTMVQRARPGGGGSAHQRHDRGLLLGIQQLGRLEARVVGQRRF
jgi:hypothetical protein